MGPDRDSRPCLQGGGYQYRICKKDPSGAAATEECYQQTPLTFATDTTQIKYPDGSRPPFFINATTTDKGTWPVGSQWRKNPVPMCNCDIGTGCGAKTSVGAPVVDEAKGGTCKAVVQEQCGDKTGYNTCLKCGNRSSYDCETCCPGLTKVTKGEYTYCTDEKPQTCSKDNPRACFGRPYPTSYLALGQQIDECPTGLMFPAPWADSSNAGAGIGGRFIMEMVDKLNVPNVAPGEYSLSWRWDCEQVRPAAVASAPSALGHPNRILNALYTLTSSPLASSLGCFEQTPQVWNSCADITITA